jgi:hypothetical protein
MANMILPYAERMMTPDEVEALDRRRRRGQLFLVVGCQFLVVAILVTVWAGQDLTYSPGWHRPMAFWDGIAFLAAFTLIVRGVALRRGSNEFISY